MQCIDPLFVGFPPWRNPAVPRRRLRLLAYAPVLLVSDRSRERLGDGSQVAPIVLVGMPWLP